MKILLEIEEQCLVKMCNLENLHDDVDINRALESGI